MSKYLENYEYLCNEIDAIFDIPKTFRDLFLNALKSDDLESTEVGIARNSKDNALRMLNRISDDSIAESYKSAYQKLYENGLVLVVSSSEMILRDIYDDVFRDRFDQIPSIQQMNIKVGDLNFDNGLIKKADLVDLIRKQKYDDKNPSTKLYFENIKALESQFGALGINLNLSGDLTKMLHKYYQFRHVLIHQRGKIDEIFIHNLAAVDADADGYVNGAQLIVDEQDYDECKRLFSELIKILEDRLQVNG